MRIALNLRDALPKYCALGQVGRPPHPRQPPGRSTLRSLSEATNYDQPQVRILLGVLFCGDDLQLLLQPDRGRRGEAAGVGARADQSGQLRQNSMACSAADENGV